MHPTARLLLSKRNISQVITKDDYSDVYFLPQKNTFGCIVVKSKVDKESEGMGPF